MKVQSWTDLWKTQIVQAVMFVIEAISQLKFSTNSSSLWIARKVVLDKKSHENEAGGLKSRKIQAISRCNEGTIVDGEVKNPIHTSCNVIETITVLNFRKLKAQCSS